jgi:hypothetical protein
LIEGVEVPNSLNIRASKINRVFVEESMVMDVGEEQDHRKFDSFVPVSEGEEVFRPNEPFRVTRGLSYSRSGDKLNTRRFLHPFLGDHP